MNAVNRELETHRDLLWSKIKLHRISIILVLWLECCYNCLVIMAAHDWFPLPSALPIPPLRALWRDKNTDWSKIGGNWLSPTHLIGSWALGAERASPGKSGTSQSNGAQLTSCSAWHVLGRLRCTIPDPPGTSVWALPDAYNPGHRPLTHDPSSMMSPPCVVEYSSWVLWWVFVRQDRCHLWETFCPHPKCLTLTGALCPRGLNRGFPWILQPFVHLDKLRFLIHAAISLCLR